MSSLVKIYRKFKEQQDGNSSIEFVFLFPAVMFIFLMGFEAGYYMVRNAMLERALDVAVRDVRLGNGNIPDYAALKTRLCDEVGIVDDCDETLQIELKPVAIQPGALAAVSSDARCIDTNSAADPLTGTTYNVGQINNMMMVRACLLAKPLFPTTGIGAGMSMDGEGHYALVATSAFVNEPGKRGIVGANTSGPTVMTSYDSGQGNGSDGGDPGASEGVNHGGDEDSYNPGNGNQ
ncbi:TadE/TadG family type IV pilus assembly protein [Roseibium sp.]|uniref:TadE/TadG family type IV pilus assembly protein n=1 Tax=Roseibium sp. TaxID=1936156 RepID=UPI003D0F2EB2